MAKSKPKHEVIGVDNLNRRSRFLDAQTTERQRPSTNNGLSKHKDRQVAKLVGRKLAFDSLSTDQRHGRKRPGSMNPKKQA